MIASVGMEIDISNKIFYNLNIISRFTYFFRKCGNGLFDFYQIRVNAEFSMITLRHKTNFRLHRSLESPIQPTV